MCQCAPFTVADGETIFLGSGTTVKVTFAAVGALAQAREHLGQIILFQLMSGIGIHSLHLVSAWAARCYAAPLVRAESVEIGLRIVSALRRDIDLASILVERPKVNILVGADGRTNIPGPRIPGNRDPVTEILRLAVGRFELRNGAFEFDSRRFPLDLSGRDLGARVEFDSAGPRYRGEVGARELRMGAPGAPAAALDFAAALERNRVDFSRFRLALGHSSLTGSARVETFKAPRAAGEVDAAVWLADAARFIRLPVEREGHVRIKGKAAFTSPEDYSFAGRAEGRALTADDLGTIELPLHRPVQLTGIMSPEWDGVLGTTRLVTLRFGSRKMILPSGFNSRLMFASASPRW